MLTMQESCIKMEKELSQSSLCDDSPLGDGALGKTVNCAGMPKAPSVRELAHGVRLKEFVLPQLCLLRDCRRPPAADVAFLHDLFP